MATANFQCFDVVSENTNGSIIGHYIISCDYDTTTLVIQDLNILNQTGISHTAVVQSLDGTKTASEVIPDGTNLQVNIASHSVLMLNTVRGIRPPVVIS